jgi:hypothetical protein
MILKNPQLDGANLIYDIEILEGATPLGQNTHAASRW